MKTKLRCLTIFCLVCCCSCRDELEVYSIERLGVFSFSTDNLNTEYANDVRFYQGKVVLYYFDAASYVLYTRYLLEARGKNTAGRDLIVSIEFDITSNDNYIGTYRPQYEPALGGIHSFNLLEANDSGTYTSYSLDPAYLQDTYLRVERQNQEAKLILGDFFARLQNEQDSTDKLTIYQGIFKDINYGS